LIQVSRSRVCGRVEVKILRRLWTIFREDEVGGTARHLKDGETVKTAGESTSAHHAAASEAAAIYSSLFFITDIFQRTSLDTGENFIQR
jgi:hypothetical protein